MKRVLIAVAFVASAAFPVLAHQGHHNRIMGMVSMIHDTHLEVKGTTGKISTIVLDEHTKVLKGTDAVKRTAIRDGDRVVVTAMTMKSSDGKPMLLAEEVRLAAAPAAKPTRKK